jgi:hypothetical protein
MSNSNWTYNIEEKMAELLVDADFEVVSDEDMSISMSSPGKESEKSAVFNDPKTRSETTPKSPELFEFPSEFSLQVSTAKIDEQTKNSPLLKEAREYVYSLYQSAIKSGEESFEFKLSKYSIFIANEIIREVFCKFSHLMVKDRIYTSFENLANNAHTSDKFKVYIHSTYFNKQLKKQQNEDEDKKGLIYMTSIARKAAHDKIFDAWKDTKHKYPSIRYTYDTYYYNNY